MTKTGENCCLLSLWARGATPLSNHTTNYSLTTFCYRQEMNDKPVTRIDNREHVQQGTIIAAIGADILHKVKQVAKLQRRSESGAVLLEDDSALLADLPAEICEALTAMVKCGNTVGIGTENLARLDKIEGLKLTQEVDTHLGEMVSLSPADEILDLQSDVCASIGQMLSKNNER